MPRQAVMDGIDKHTRHRLHQKELGMKLVRMWLPNTSTPEFQFEARRQAALIRGTPEDIDAMNFADAAADLSGWDAEVRDA